MDTDIASENDISIPNKQASTSPRRRRFALAFLLSIVVGGGILAALVALTQSASAQTAPKGQGPDAPPISGAPVSPDCNASWNVVSSPNPGSVDDLVGVTAVSASNVWAVGSYKAGGVYRTPVEHWDGSAWTHVSSPNVGAYDNDLNGVAAVSSSDVWAVGYYVNNVNGTASQTLVEHWDGSAWTHVSSPSPGT